MNKEVLSRLLIKKLSASSPLTYWKLQAAVNEAIHEALREHDELEELMCQLRTRIVRFSYRKTDGSTREAIGTLKPSVLETLSAFLKQKSNRSNQTNCVVYYDLDREEWRSFCPENFLTML